MRAATKIILLLFSIVLVNTASASGSRFKANWRSTDGAGSGLANCNNGYKRCIASGMKIIEGIKVTRDCWQYSYDKTCDFPSKNNCRIYEHCYALGDRQCLVQDSYGNCVNMLREFSCKSWEVVSVENRKVRTDLHAKDGPEQLVCKGVPCIDGNCVDKSYETNGEVMDSVSRLYAAKSMTPDKAGNFNLFQGNNMHCSKKPVGAMNCCGIGQDGWAGKLGVGCTKDEKMLLDMRNKKLCVYAGKKRTGMEPVHVSKHHFCCFGNMLDKVIQIQGRAQLYPEKVANNTLFGTGEKPDCRGLTLDEIKAIDFNKIDFTEFIEDFKKKFLAGPKIEGIGDIEQRIKGSMGGMRDGNDDISNRDNNGSGWHKTLNDRDFDPSMESQ
jgi:Type-1V conjugative transfer system mating pair stabilisation